jgi:hypothetical protein
MNPLFFTAAALLLSFPHVLKTLAVIWLVRLCWLACRK